MSPASRRAGWLAILFCAAALWAGAPRAKAAEPPARRQVLVLLRLAPEHYRPNSDYGGGYGDDLARGARRRLAEKIARSNRLSLVTYWPMPLLGLDCYVMAVPDGESPETIAARISRQPGVAWSEPLHEFHAKADPITHNDPLFRAQPAAQAWRLADLHRVATGRDVKVAVIDSHVERTHPDLAGQVVVQEDFAMDRPHRPEAHGTGVAGVIAAKADNGVGIAGVAPGARLMALRACWQTDRGGPDGGATVCDSLSLAKAVHFAVDRGAQVINLSLSGPSDRLLGSLIDTAEARGITVVAAYDKALPHGGFPASHPGVIAVAEDSVAQPPQGVYTAPGRDVPTTAPGGRWVLVNGSSYAAAHVSGLLALVRERQRRAGGKLDLVSSRPGGGMVDACASLLRPPSRCDCSCALAGQQTFELGR
jgi:hypothetical protein